MLLILLVCVKKVGRPKAPLSIVYMAEVIGFEPTGPVRLDSFGVLTEP